MIDLLISERELSAAFGLLFAPEARNGRKVLEFLQEAEIKSAYRKKALQTHPDMFAALGPRLQRIYSERFIDLNKSYEMLSAFVKAREKGFTFKYLSPEARQSLKTRREREPRSKRGDYQSRTMSYGSFVRALHTKDLPGRPLRFGEFLYYCGVIEWKELMRALLWQSSQRPKIGEIAQKWRWIDESQVDYLIKNRPAGVLIGQAMLSYNLISPFQLSVLIRQQRKTQKLIGQYFIEQRMITRGQIFDILNFQEKHNVKFRYSRAY